MNSDTPTPRTDVIRYADYATQILSHEQLERELLEAKQKLFMLDGDLANHKAECERLQRELDHAQELAQVAGVEEENFHAVCKERERLEKELAKTLKWKEEVISNAPACSACASTLFTGGVWPECGPHTCAMTDRDRWKAMAEDTVALLVCLSDEHKTKLLTLLSRFNALKDETK